MLRALGAVMIIASCTAAGFEASFRLTKRRDNLEKLIAAVTSAERDMQFFKEPLGNLFDKTGRKTDGSVGYLFVHVAERIKKNPFEAEKIWQSELESSAKELCFSKSDTTKIGAVFSGIGKTDSVSQIRIMQSAIDTLRQAADEANELCRKNTKVYRGLGILLGMLISLLLI